MKSEQQVKDRIKVYLAALSYANSEELKKDLKELILNLKWVLE